MVAGCPKCSARYRVDADRIGADGAKLRCTKCSAVFLVRAPKARAAAQPEPSAAPAPPPPSAPEAPSEIDRTRLVLVDHITSDQQSMLVRNEFSAIERQVYQEIDTCMYKQGYRRPG